MKTYETRDEDERIGILAEPAVMTYGKAQAVAGDFGAEDAYAPRKEEIAGWVRQAKMEFQLGLCRTPEQVHESICKQMGWN